MPAKKLLTDYIQEFDGLEVNEPLSDELNDYLQFYVTRNSPARAVAHCSVTVVPQPAAAPFSIINWWREHHDKFPKLTQCASFQRGQ